MQFKIEIGFLCAVFYCFIINEAANIFWGKRNKNIVRLILTISINVVLIMVSSICADAAVEFLVVQVAGNLLWTLNYSLDYKRQMATIMLSNIIVAAITSCVWFCFQTLYNESILMIIIAAIEYTILKICKILRNCSRVINNVLIVSLPLVLISTAVSAAYIGNNENCLRVLILISVILAVMLLMVIYNNIIWNVSVELEQGYLLEQNESYKKQISVIMDSSEKIRTVRHDMKNHISVVLKMLEEGQCNNAIQYLQFIEKDIKTYNNRVDTGNFEFDAILNKKFEEIVENNIANDYKIKVPAGLSIAPMDIAIVLGNLLDNAIEAAKQSDSGEPYIWSFINYEKGMLVIRIKNSCKKDEPVKYSGLPTSTKQNKMLHGIGLHNVKRTIEKYNGKMELNRKEDEFCIVVTMYI